MKKILISGYHGFGNCGDEAILAAIVNNLRKADPDIKIVALSRTPSETREKFRVKSVNRFNVFSIIYEMLSCNLVLSGGGSLLQDVTSSRSLYYYLGIIVMARLLGRPVMVYANGIGPVRKRLNRFFTRLVLNRVSFITLRDKDSFRELYEMGVKRPQVLVSADPVFTMEAVSEVQAEQILRNENIELQRPLIGISLRPWKNSSAWLRKISLLADRLIDHFDCNILFLPMHIPNDAVVIEQVRALMQKPSFAIQGSYSGEEMMGIIGHTRVIISMRLHTLIFAAVQRVPMIGLVYDPKVRSFLDAVGQPVAGDIDSLDVDELFNILQEMLDNYEEMVQTLDEQAVRLKEKAHINDQTVMQLLKY